jgi:hypothetical protein
VMASIADHVDIEHHGAGTQVRMRFALAANRDRYADDAVSGGPSGALGSAAA